jgi:hypothetical protein
MNEVVEEQHSWFYWVWKHNGERVRAFLHRHRHAFYITLGAILFLVIYLRPLIHEPILTLRIRAFPILLGVVLILGLVALLKWKRLQWKWRALGGSVTFALLAALILWGSNVQDGLSLLERHRTLNKIELAQDPTTDHERIQPFESIETVASEKLSNGGEEVDIPDFVRVGSDYRWTMSIGPAYWLTASGLPFVGDAVVRGVYNLSATAPSPDWSHRIPVHFITGDQLRLSHEIDTCVKRAFGPWMFLNYDIGETKYMVDDSDQWVQVVPLIKWVGFFFPRPEFGGVMVIPQMEETWGHWIEGFTIGCGTWVPPSQIKNHPFLVGQNLLPYAVTRYMAESLRFQGGWTGPLSGVHTLDVRIPKPHGETNEMPYVSFFKGIPNESDKLYHFFALEPYNTNISGLSVELFIPGDRATDVVYTRHPTACTSVSAVGSKVRESEMKFDWANNIPIEHRPYVREIMGKPRFAWLTTVVAKKEGSDTGGIAGSIPKIVLTDCQANVSVWVDVLHPETWTTDLEKKIREAGREGK